MNFIPLCSQEGQPTDVQYGKPTRATNGCAGYFKVPSLKIGIPTFKRGGVTTNETLYFQMNIGGTSGGMWDLRTKGLGAPTRCTQAVRWHKGVDIRPITAGTTAIETLLKRNQKAVAFVNKHISRVLRCGFVEGGNAGARMYWQLCPNDEYGVDYFFNVADAVASLANFLNILGNNWEPIPISDIPNVKEVFDQDVVDVGFSGYLSNNYHKTEIQVPSWLKDQEMPFMQLWSFHLWDEEMRGLADDLDAVGSQSSGKSSVDIFMGLNSGYDLNTANALGLTKFHEPYHLHMGASGPRNTTFVKTDNAGNVLSCDQMHWHIGMCGYPKHAPANPQSNATWETDTRACTPIMTNKARSVMAGMDEVGRGRSIQDFWTLETLKGALANNGVTIEDFCVWKGVMSHLVFKTFLQTHEFGVIS